MPSKFELERMKRDDKNSMRYDAVKPKSSLIKKAAKFTGGKF